MTKKKSDSDDERAEAKAESGKKAEVSLLRRLPVLLMVEVVVATAALVGLAYVVKWWAALSIASALFVFLDAAIHHVKKITPSSKESKLGLFLWSLAGFVPFAGILAYALLREKLASAPAAKITSGQEAVETVKSRMRVVSIPTAIVIALIATAIGWKFRLGPFKIEFGTNITRGLFLEGVDDTFEVGTIVVKLSSSRPLEGYPNLDWRLYMGGSDAPIQQSTVRVAPGSNKMIWWWKVRASHPGDYEVSIIDNTGKELKRGCFTTIPRRR